MFMKNVFNFFIFCIILKYTTSNVSGSLLPTTTSELRVEVSNFTTQLEINSTSDQLSTEQVIGEKGL